MPRLISQFTLRRYFVLAICCVLWSGARADTAPTDAQKIQTANWQVHDIAPGVVLRQAQFAELFGAPQSVSIVEVDMQQDVTVGIAGVSPQLRLTSDLAREKDAVAAINGTFFDMKNGGSVMLVKSAGKVIDPSRGPSSRGNGAITIEGKTLAIIAGGLQDADWETQLTAPDVMVSGPVLLLNGKAAALSQAGFNRLRHPRSAVAITTERKLLLVAVDGRHKEAGGMSLFSLTELLANLGARDALNLDGGGSTTLFATGQGENGVVNYPSDNNKFDHKGERRVSSIIWVAIEKQE